MLTVMLVGIVSCRLFLRMPDRSRIMVDMNRLDNKTRRAIVSALVEGCSIRATVRMTGAAKGTVLKLLADLGRVCAEYQHDALRNLPCKRLQVDEIWSFVGKKERATSAEDKAAGLGDVWTWTAICADTKLVPSWLVGGRDGGYAHEFMTDLASRLTGRVQLTSDGHRAYLAAVEDAFGADVDYAMCIKLFGQPVGHEARYSPPVVIGTEVEVVQGNPDRAHISTSYAERQNLTMRMSMRRFTRLTNGFSKKAENLAHAVAIHFMHYNFCRIHQTLRVTPAMAAGVSDRLWEIDDLVALLVQAEDAREAALGPRRTRGRKVE